MEAGFRMGCEANKKPRSDTDKTPGSFAARILGSAMRFSKERRRTVVHEPSGGSLGARIHGQP
jgi:hypothetical protein